MNLEEKALEGVAPADLGLFDREARDYQVLLQRAGGLTLEEIGEQTGLTRERIRQIIERQTTNGGKAFWKRVQLQKKENEQDLLNLICSWVAERPGITIQELVDRFSLSAGNIKALLPKDVSKLVQFPIEESHIEKQYTDQDCFKALQLASAYHFPLAKSQYDDLLAIKEISGPSSALLWRRFGSWTRACELAGVESNASHGNYQSLWAPDELINYLVRFLRQSKTRSIQEYSSWRISQPDHVPSDQLLRIVFDGWSAAIQKAHMKMREDWANLGN
jgi:hypothetical protein